MSEVLSGCALGAGVDPGGSDGARPLLGDAADPVGSHAHAAFVRCACRARPQREWSHFTSLRGLLVWGHGQLLGRGWALSVVCSTSGLWILRIELAVSRWHVGWAWKRRALSGMEFR